MKCASQCSVCIFKMHALWICSLCGFHLRQLSTVVTHAVLNLCGRDSQRTGLLFTELITNTEVYAYYIDCSRWSDSLWTGWSGFETRQGLNFSLRHHVQIGYGAHLASHLKCTCYKADGTWIWKHIYIKYVEFNYPEKPLRCKDNFTVTFSFH
jgi:hypothetical protein